MSTTIPSLSDDQHSVNSDKFKLIADQYNNIDAWLYAFPTPLAFFQFFEKKLNRINSQYSKLVDLINDIKCHMERGIQREEDTNELHRRIHSLEDNLSKVQTCLYDERENYAKLVNDNEMLKLENEDYRRKFQAVLLMSKIDERDVTLFMQKNPKAASLTDKMIEIKDDIRKCVGPKRGEAELLNPLVLLKQIKILEEHLKTLGAVQQEKEYVLKEQLRLTQEDKDHMRRSYENRLSNSVHKTSELKDLVHNLVLENVSMGQKIISAEEDWLHERDKLLKVAAHTHFLSLQPTTSSNCLTKRRVSDDSEAVKKLQQKLSLAELKIMEKENLIEEYKFRVLRMEKQSFHLQEVGDELKKIHKDDVRKLIDKNKAIEKRCEEIDSRRKLDNSGFREDIRGLKSLLTSLERRFRVCERKQSSGIKVNPKVEVPIRAITAPAHLSSNNNNNPNPPGGDSTPLEETDSDGKEVLTWEALNCLLAIAGKKVCQLERRIKQGCPSAKF